MSKSYFYGINKLLKVDDILKIPIILRTLIVHPLYAYGTQKEIQIEIDKTYTYTKNGYTDFMCIDKTGKHYNVNNSLWYWKWDSIEDWNKLNLDDKINIKYYGYRIPVLGFFPNIVCIDNKEYVEPFINNNNMLENNYQLNII